MLDMREEEKLVRLIGLGWSGVLPHIALMSRKDTEKCTKILRVDLCGAMYLCPVRA